MALKFSDVNGSAKKNEYYKMKDGVNTFRLVGDVLPRYVYWVKDPHGSDSRAFECLSFDREKEKFTNAETDHVQGRVTVKDPKTGVEKPITCSWAYVCQVIADGKLQTFNLKKKMFESILSNARKLGDPTDIEEGYDIIVERKKTGPQAFNVEYTLGIVDMMQAGKRPLNDEERELLAGLKPVEELIPRPTAEEQLVELEKFLSGGNDSSETTSNTDAEAVNDLDD